MSVRDEVELSGLHVTQTLVLEIKIEQTTRAASRSDQVGHHREQAFRDLDRSRRGDLGQGVRQSGIQESSPRRVGVLGRIDTDQWLQRDDGAPVLCGSDPGCTAADGGDRRLGLSLLVARLTVHFRDLDNLLNHLLRMWMYFSGVLFPIDLAPEGWIRELAANGKMAEETFDQLQVEAEDAAEVGGYDGITEEAERPN